MTRAVPRGPEAGCHGISLKVAMSGIRYWSDSAIRVKPSIELPSNHVPWVTELSSWWMGMVTALTIPRMSVNCSWTNRMPLALAVSIVSSASLLSATANPTSSSAVSIVRPARIRRHRRDLARVYARRRGRGVGDRSAKWA